jgi:hypothetical protein
MELMLLASGMELIPILVIMLVYTCTHLHLTKWLILIVPKNIGQYVVAGVEVEIAASAHLLIPSALHTKYVRRTFKKAQLIATTSNVLIRRIAQVAMMPVSMEVATLRNHYH